MNLGSYWVETPRIDPRSNYEVPAIGQELRPSVDHRLTSQHFRPGKFSRGATGCGYPVQLARVGKQNHPLAAPRRPRCLSLIAQRLRDTSRGEILFSFPSAKKPMWRESEEKNGDKAPSVF